MKQHTRTAICLLLLTFPMASFAAYMAPEGQWFGSDTGEPQDAEGLETNITIIKDCLNENKSDRANCVGITKAFCSLTQATCNRFEATAWDTLAMRKRPALKKSQTAWKRRVAASCRSRNADEGYANVNPRDPWLDNLLPSGCALEVSADRYLRLK